MEGLAVGQFHGIGPVTAARLNQLGVFTGGDLRAQPVELLTQHFGKAGRYYHAIAYAEDHRPVVPDRVRKSVGSETTFAQDLHAPAELLAALPPLLDEVWGLVRAHRGAGPHRHAQGEVCRLPPDYAQPQQRGPRARRGHAGPLRPASWWRGWARCRWACACWASRSRTWKPRARTPGRQLTLAL